jgi:hypothetical protein
MARLLPASGARVRRGRRRDLPALAAVLGPEASVRLERVFRRILADLRNDVYVAEDARGEIVGLVSIVYARSLVRGGLSALLDGARARQVPARPLLEELVAFAEERARRRGCQRLTAWVGAEDAELRAALLARGYRTGELLVAEPPGAA